MGGREGPGRGKRTGMSAFVGERVKSDREARRREGEESRIERRGQNSPLVLSF